MGALQDLMRCKEETLRLAQEEHNCRHWVQAEAQRLVALRHNLPSAWSARIRAKEVALEQLAEEWRVDKVISSIERQAEDDADAPVPKGAQGWDWAFSARRARQAQTVLDKRESGSEYDSSANEGSLGNADNEAEVQLAI